MTAKNRPKLFLVIEPAITLSSPSCANPGSNIRISPTMVKLCYPLKVFPCNSIVSSYVPNILYKDYAGNGSEGVLALRAKIIPPCTKGTFPGITVPSGRITAVAAARKVKKEPKNTGTLNLVQQWNIKLPSLAENNANDRL